MKQEGADASSVKLNLTFHYSTETGRYRGGGMPDRRVGSPVTVYAQVRVQCREPKTGQQKVQFSNKTKHFACLGILFICFQQTGEPTLAISGHHLCQI